MNQGDEFYQTRDTRLVACLTAVGIELSPVQPFAKYKNHKTGKEQIMWNVQLKSACGKYDTNQLVRAYHDPKLMHDQDDLIGDFAHAVAGLKNREFLIDIVQNSDCLIESWQGDSVWLVPSKSKVAKELLS